MFRVVEGRPVREQLRFLHLNAVQLSKLLQENVPSYKKGKPVSSAGMPVMLCASVVPGVFLLLARRALLFMRQLSASGGHSVGASASAGVLPMNIQG